MVELPPGSNIDLGQVSVATRNDPLIPLRAGAVNAYAGLEQSLCRIFARCLGTDTERANIVFYRIVNTKSRNTIITKLMRKQFGEEYTTWWNSLLKLIRQLDDARNKIIHWHVVQNIDAREDGRNIVVLTLEPPELLATPQWGEAEPVTSADLEAFIIKASFVSRFLNMFDHHHREQLDGPWPDIFQQAVAYPPGPDHPLNH